MIHFLNPLYEATDEELCIKMAQLLKEARKRQRMSRDVLSAKAGMHVTQLARIENTGKVTLRNFIAITRALGELDRLFDAYAVPELKPSEEYELEMAKEKLLKKIRRKSKQK